VLEQIAAMAALIVASCSLFFVAISVSFFMASVF
jgi:hypothetical protein